MTKLEENLDSLADNQKFIDVMIEFRKYSGFDNSSIQIDQNGSFSEKAMIANEGRRSAYLWLRGRMPERLREKVERRK